MFTDRQALKLDFIHVKGGWTCHRAALWQACRPEGWILQYRYCGPTCRKGLPMFHRRV